MLSSRCKESGRLAFIVSLWSLVVVGGTVTRLAILAGPARDLGSDARFAVLARGVLLDAAVAMLLLAPVAIATALSSGGWIRRPRFRVGVLWIVAAAVAFGGSVEYFFFEEFDARLNHVAIDYLFFPDEVAGNIWESYPVPVFAAGSLGLGLIAAMLIERRLRSYSVRSQPWSGRAARVFAVLAASAIALSIVHCVRSAETTDRQAHEVASNGLVEFVDAVRTASLDYAAYYRTVPHEASLVDACASAASREFPATRKRTEPLDVVVILGESFGSEFVGRLGGKRPCAPGLERWADKGLLLTNLVATGNRTVRGLEGVLCSFVPLPGDSVWKRNRSDDVASIARVLRSRGFRTEFVYGGDGMFDGMRSFALRNGWDAFLDDSVVGASSFAEDAFHTVWGVADEHVYAQLLGRQRAAAREGQRFFGTALTVSNHKPFLTPESEVRGLRRDRLYSAGTFGLGLLVASCVAWRLVSARWGRRRTGVALSVAWLLFAVVGWAEAQPRGSREVAVRYADRALADYLDRAEAEGLLEHTVVLFVGDHGARVYGSEEIPASSYRIPGLFLAPDPELAGVTIPRLCSQVDLAPTLLSIAGVSYTAPFFGQDLLAQDRDGPGRAYLIHNRNIGLLTDTTLTVLGLKRTTTFYRRSDRSSDAFVLAAPTEELCEDADRAALVFQTASILYEGGRYRIDDAP